MKRLFAIIAAMVIGGAAYAQNYFDAETLGENTYYGTARSIALGNAMTALGGDLGSIGINPAGGAVASYGQITITPNISVSTNSGAYASIAGTGFGDSCNDSYTRFTLPNFGATAVFRTNNIRGIKSYTFGFIGNATNNYMSTVYAEGMNSATSIAGAMATAATGQASSDLATGNYYGYSDWQSMVAYQSGLISTYDGLSDEYLGVTEVHSNGQIGLAGALDQAYGQRKHGNKYDWLLNFGMNVDNVLYVGANLGITTTNYESGYYVREYAVEPSNFVQEYDDGTTLTFDNLRYQYTLTSSGSGVYAKLGLIWKPLPYLRLGAAIQTPTSIEVHEEWQHAAQVHFLEESTGDRSDIGSWEYRLRTPWRWNAGLAWTFGHVGLVSMDYEMADYGSMKYRNDFQGNYSGDWDGVNASIEKFGALQQTLRVGVELRPLPFFAVRAGYNYFTNPKKVFYDNDGVVDAAAWQECYDSDMSNADFWEWDASLYGKTMLNRDRHIISLGFGYSSEGSFFCDFAGRYTIYKTEYIAPYADYISDTLSPEISSKLRLLDLVLTIGWRF